MTWIIEEVLFSLYDRSQNYSERRVLNFGKEIETILPTLLMKKRGKGRERNEMEENWKGSWKVYLLLWNSLFFWILSLLISYIRLRCVFSFCMVSEKMREKVMALYIHFLLSINIRVFLKFVSLFLFDLELLKHIGLPK